MAKVEDKIVIKGFASDEPSSADYVNKTSIVEFI